MGNSSYKHILSGLLAPFLPLLISGGILALCTKASMPPTWFFLLQWILFAMLLLLLQKKQKEQAEPQPAPVQDVKEQKAEEPEKEAEEPEKEPAPASPAPFIPPMPQAQELPAEEPAAPLPSPATEEKKESSWQNAVLIDETIIKRHIILGEEFVRKLFDIFVEDSPARLEEMQKALEQNMFENLRHAAHALKGSAAAIGAKRLSGICLKIQKDCDGKTFEKIQELLKEAGEIFKETRTAVEKYDFSKLEN